MTNSAAYIRAYLHAIEAGNLQIEDWYTADALQIEWPNKLMPMGAKRDLTMLKEAARRGSEVVERQWYEVTNLVADRNLVATEAIFRAVFKTDLPDLPKGEIMEARFAMFFEISDGKIRRHTTYDCFMPAKLEVVPRPAG